MWLNNHMLCQGFLVPVAGVEPARPFRKRGILSPLCLPISPYGHLVPPHGVEPRTNGL